MEIKKRVQELLTVPELSYTRKLDLLAAWHAGSIKTEKDLHYLIQGHNGTLRHQHVNEIGHYGGAWWNKMVFDQVGATVPGHTHDFDHVTFIAKGAVRISGKDYQAPAMVLVPAEVEHELVGLEAGSIAYCIHSTRQLGTSLEGLDEAGDIVPYEGVTVLEGGPHA